MINKPTEVILSRGTSPVFPLCFFSPGDNSAWSYRTMVWNGETFTDISYPGDYVYVPIEFMTKDYENEIETRFCLLLEACGIVPKNADAFVKVIRNDETGLSKDAGQPIREVGFALLAGVKYNKRDPGGFDHYKTRAKQLAEIVMTHPDCSSAMIRDRESLEAAFEVYLRRS